MGIGVSIILLVVGLILVLGAIEIPSGLQDVVATDTVGWICVVVGVLGLVLAVATSRSRGETTVVEERRQDV